MTDMNMKELKHLIPDFELQLEEEKANAIKSALARIPKEYNHFEASIMNSLRSYDDLVEQGYKPLHAQHRNLGTGFNFVYEKPDNVIEEEKNKAIDKIHSEFNERLLLIKEEYIQDIIGNELAEKEAEKLNEIEENKKLLKEKLLSTLFK